MTERRRSWHIEKGIPLAYLAGILLQTFAIAWWAATLSSRVDVLEKNMSGSALQTEHLIRLDERVSVIQSSVAELKGIVQASQARK